MKFQDRLLVVTILLHHIYIVFLNTSSVHGLYIPDKAVWTLFLTLFLITLGYYYLQEPATTWYEKSLYFAIILSIAAAILRGFTISVEIRLYSLFLVIIAILTTIVLIVHQHNQMRFMLLGLYTLEIFLLISRVFDINNVVQTIGPLVELMIVIGILYYNYSLGFAFDELFIVIIVTLTGWYLGDFIYTFDVPALVVSTLFEQTLSVGQYSVTAGIEPRFFLSLHMAEVFNIIIVQVLAGRSWNAFAIILTGLDMTYPPLSALRAFVLLIFLRKTIKGDADTTAEIGRDTSNEKLYAEGNLNSTSEIPVSES